MYFKRRAGPRVPPPPGSYKTAALKAAAGEGGSGSAGKGGRGALGRPAVWSLSAYEDLPALGRVGGLLGMPNRDLHAIPAAASHRTRTEGCCPTAADAAAAGRKRKDSSSAPVMPITGAALAAAAAAAADATVSALTPSVWMAGFMLGLGLALAARSLCNPCLLFSHC